MSKVKLPQRVTVSDYHEFGSLEDCLDKTGIKVKEIGHCCGGYTGILYVGRLRDPDNKKLIDAIKADSRAEEV